MADPIATTPPPAPPPGGGIRCPSCGCQDLRVIYTRHRRGRIVRRRECRYCGRRLLTYEHIAFH